MGRDGSSGLFQPTIKVIGVGGGGGNVVARMGRDRASGVELVACNTDRQALARTGAARQVLLGEKITKGYGAGSHADVGRRCAEQSAEELRAVLTGGHLVFITAGLGGGTGSGAAPVVAGLARAQGGLAVAVVTLPFGFEGRRRAKVAAEALAELSGQADIVLVIPNDRLLEVTDRDVTLLNAFAMADDVLRDVIHGISELLMGVGLINVDFADVRTVMENKGKGVIGMGRGQGEVRMLEAVRGAVNNPLMGKVDISGAKGLLIHVTGGEGLGILEINEAMEELRHQAGEETNLIFGATTSPEMGEAVSALVIATGIADY